MTHVTDRFVLSDNIENAITALEEAGFSLAGTTTHAGHLQELAYFNFEGVQIDINFRHMRTEKPVRREVLP